MNDKPITEPLDNPKIRVVPQYEDWLPLDRRWLASARLDGKTIGAYGSTREDALGALKARLAKIGN